MADISSVSAVVTPPVSLPQPAQASVPSSTQDIAPSAQTAPKGNSTYTALATVSASNIRGVGVNQSA